MIEKKERRWKRGNLCYDATKKEKNNKMYPKNIHASRAMDRSHFRPRAETERENTESWRRERIVRRRRRRKKRTRVYVRTLMCVIGVFIS